MLQGKESSTIRAFVALDLDAQTVRRIARVADRLRMGSGAPRADWTPSAKMHVTLVFVGELLVDDVVPLGHVVNALAAGKEAPRLGTFRLDAFPAVERTRVVVAELEDPCGDVRKLALALERAAGKGVDPGETRPFRPHVTLARLKRPYDASRWLRRDLTEGADECHAAAMTLYRSDRSAEGSTYVPLARCDYPTRA